MTFARSRFAFLMVVAVACGSAACGGSGSPSVTGPSAIGGNTAAGAGATINGRVNGGSGLPQMASLTTAATTTTGLTVTVAGTSISVPVGSSGEFTLRNVPAGNITLLFSGSGINASVSLTVGAQEQIQIAVTVSGTNARVESEHRSGGDDNRAEVDGRITEANATARTLRVSGTLVTVPADATIRRGSAPLSFADLKVGDEVEVLGTRDSTGLKASRIEVKAARIGDLSEREGLVSGLTGTCPALTFSVGSTKVTTDGTTFFEDGTCADVKNGTEVEVKGRPQTDGSILAALVELSDEDHDDADDDDDSEDEGGFEGIVGTLTDTCPAITFMLQTRQITTTNTTRFDGGVCTAIKNGSKVEVEGNLQANGSVVATRVEIVNEAP